MTRLLTAALLLPLAFYLILYSPRPVFLGAAILVAIVCYREFSMMADAQGLVVDAPSSYACGLILLVVPDVDPVVLVLLAMAALVSAMRSNALSVVMPQSAATVLGVLYIFGSLRCMAGLRQMSPYWLLYALALNWVGDSAAYYVGSLAGRHKLAPHISPAKSWEGAGASLATAMIFGVVFLGRVMPGTGWMEAALLSAAANMAGQLGDLSESALKRGAGVKDSGNFLPGHGGVLDRLDSSLFSAPVVYFWLVRGTMSIRG
jgi:phosphatidate cytidylyltransferase